MYQQENIDFEKFKKRPRFLFDLVVFNGTEEYHNLEEVEAESLEKAQEMLLRDIVIGEHYRLKISRVFLEVYNEEN